MNFQVFLEYVSKLKEVVLPGEEAHCMMAPSERIQYLQKIKVDSENPRIASVLMLLYSKNNETHLVLIVRNTYEGIHSAQIAFPGGKFEPSDENFVRTALRETYEEIGIHPDAIEIIKPFTKTYIPPSNFMVYPFLGISNKELVFVPDPSEVAEIIELPLSVFLSDEIMVKVNLSTSYTKNIDVPAFKIENHIVWGATAMMLSELKEVLKKVL